jgi:hypothetical protein
MPYSFLHKTTLLWLTLLPVLYSCAQKNTDLTRSGTYYPKIRFIAHAPSLLPELLAASQWGPMSNFLENWKNSTTASNELIFGIEALMTIESRNSIPSPLPCDILFYLDDYARELKKMDDPSAHFNYLIRLDIRYNYDATADAIKVLQFTRSWARRLLATRKLDDSQWLLCQVLAGKIDNPVAWYEQHKESYPAIARIQNNVGAYNNWYFTEKRDRPSGTASVLAGWWIPTGRLSKILGSHPSVGVQLGLRSKWNEYDLTWTFRFLHPTPQEYSFVRNDSMFTSTYYDGGYVGFEYTRYLLHEKHFEFGLTTGIGYDYFSVIDGFHPSDPDFSMLPINVGSFNFNNGLRFKYFFHGRGFLGLTARYNLIHYANDGGTDLSGNAFTLDLSYGSR